MRSTHWRVVERFGALASLIACRLETGRTHQIRVHMASIGHPLLGDPVYGQGFKSKAARLPPAAQAALKALARQALHAAVLGFDHPVTGAPLRFESAPPDDIRRSPRRLRQAQGQIAVDHSGSMRRFRSPVVIVIGADLPVKPRSRLGSGSKFCNRREASRLGRAYHLNFSQWRNFHAALRV